MEDLLTSPTPLAQEPVLGYALRTSETTGSHVDQIDVPEPQYR